MFIKIKGTVYNFNNITNYTVQEESSKIFLHFTSGIQDMIYFPELKDLKRIDEKLSKILFQRSLYFEID